MNECQCRSRKNIAAECSFLEGRGGRKQSKPHCRHHNSNRMREEKKTGKNTVPQTTLAAAAKKNNNNNNEEKQSCVVITLLRMGARTALLYTYVQKKNMMRSGGLRESLPCYGSSLLARREAQVRITRSVLFNLLRHAQAHNGGRNR